MSDKLFNWAMGTIAAITIGALAIIDEPVPRKAAADTCGENAASVKAESGKIVCLTKRGHRTGEVK